MKQDRNYLETFYEIVANFHSSSESKILSNIEETEGRGGMWEYAIKLTDEFQEKYENHQFDGDFYDKIDEFLIGKI